MFGCGEPEIMKCITSGKIADANQNPQIEIMNPKSPQRNLKNGAGSHFGRDIQVNGFLFLDHALPQTPGTCRGPYPVASLAFRAGIEDRDIYGHPSARHGFFRVQNYFQSQAFWPFRLGYTHVCEVSEYPFEEDIDGLLMDRKSFIMDTGSGTSV